MPCVLAGHERVEQLLRDLRRRAGAGVGHLDHAALAARRGYRHLDRPARAGGLDRVADHVPEQVRRAASRRRGSRTARPAAPTAAPCPACWHCGLSRLTAWSMSFAEVARLASAGAAACRGRGTAAGSSRSGRVAAAPRRSGSGSAAGFSARNSSTASFAPAAALRSWCASPPENWPSTRSRSVCCKLVPELGEPAGHVVDRPAQVAELVVRRRAAASGGSRRPRSAGCGASRSRTRPHQPRADRDRQPDRDQPADPAEQQERPGRVPHRRPAERLGVEDVQVAARVRVRLAERQPQAAVLAPRRPSPAGRACGRRRRGGVAVGTSAGGGVSGRRRWLARGRRAGRAGTRPRRSPSSAPAPRSVSGNVGGSVSVRATARRCAAEPPLGVARPRPRAAHAGRRRVRRRAAAAAASQQPVAEAQPHGSRSQRSGSDASSGHCSCRGRQLPGSVHG